MTDQINRKDVECHLDISHNHEAGLIPVATRKLLTALLAENKYLRLEAAYANDTTDAAIDRIEELEYKLREQALQYLFDTGQLAERLGELLTVLEEVETWVDDLGYYAEEGTELAPVFKKVKAVLRENTNG